ncbi:MAG TPA: M28 family peptidase [Gemmatimonadales bacterium]|nr:M28 family peptidase [Gemmatimonadales bacterium]
MTDSAVASAAPIQALAGLAPLLDAVSLAEPWALIERFATRKREHPDDVRWAAREIVSRLERFGVPVTVHEPEIYLSLPGAARVEAAGRTIRAKPLAMSRACPEGLAAPLAFAPTDFDPNTDQVISGPSADDAALDLRGKLVLAHGFGMSSMARHFEERGAAGLIAVHPGKNPHWGICSTVWGTPDLRDLPRKPNFVVVSVSHPDGLELIELARQGGKATVFAALEEGWYASPIPVVTIPGALEPESFVLLHGHYDSWDVGVGDNAVGDACMLEVARVLWQHRSALQRSVRIAWWPGHSTGRYAGSTWFADHYALDLYQHCIAQVNCDSPGCRWATEYLDVAWMSEAEDWARAVIRAAAGKEARGERPYQAGDYSFNNIGISSYFMLLSTMPPDLRAEKGYYTVGGCGGNIAWHTEEDTLEIADRDVLLTDMKIYLAAVAGAANATIAPFDFGRTVEEFSRSLARYQEEAGTEFDFAPARAALTELAELLDRFRAHCARLAQRPVSDPAVRRANAALRRLARLLVPVNYTTGPAFFHDPAETIPPLPDLAPALSLQDAPAERRGFIRTHLVRGQNRLVAALRDAGAVVGEAMG